ncbi:BMP and activin membrane-bound inhibitor homolog isoform X2 [Diprion similis]|uniref:BMP and activin membrane-bound inhibitor homolog isoform X2 n=1 Tax=Diprion similis TaxID=362088 RepID=UPI001EF7FBAF|nr:BMP and activin membrane-bound inhibitor homolog isoform X2 [Diprion similis]
MLPRELITFATITTLSVATAGASVNLEYDDNGMLAEEERRITNNNNNSNDNYNNNDNKGPTGREVRCFCNQAACVTQGYLCRGTGCFTELPSSLNNPSSLRPERSPWHGCLGDGFKDRQCPAGLLCCEQDLCNHVDDPAVQTKLNRTLHVLSGTQRAYNFGPIQSSNHGNQATEGWFRTATIAVPICGLVALLVLAGLAVRLLKPMPTQGDKLGPHCRAPDNAPPLLGPPKVPLV